MIFGWDDLFNFLEDLTSWAYLFKSRLNDNFHLQAHSYIFNRSLFNSFAEILLLCTIENREASFAESFTADTKLSDRSLM